jgi:DNA polymerase-1
MRHDVPEVRTPGAIALTESGHTEAFGYVQTIAGRYRRLPDIDSNHQSLRGHAEREAVNTCIQGSSADLIRAAMLRVEASQELKMLRVRLLNQVHDELVFEAPIENAERAAPIIRECMEHPFAEGEDPLCVPTPVDLKIVPSWDLAK